MSPVTTSGRTCFSPDGIPGYNPVALTGELIASNAPIMAISVASDMSFLLKLRM